jgi:hypothetical protein
MHCCGRQIYKKTLNSLCGLLKLNKRFHYVNDGMVFYYKATDQAGAIKSQLTGLHDEPNGSTMNQMQLSSYLVNYLRLLAFLKLNYSATTRLVIELSSLHPAYP